MMFYLDVRCVYGFRITATSCCFGRLSRVYGFNYFCRSQQVSNFTLMVLHRRYYPMGRFANQLKALYVIGIGWRFFHHQLAVADNYRHLVYYLM